MLHTKQRPLDLAVPVNERGSGSLPLDWQSCAAAFPTLKPLKQVNQSLNAAVRL